MHAWSCCQVLLLPGDPHGQLKPASERHRLRAAFAIPTNQDTCCKTYIGVCDGKFTVPFRSLLCKLRQVYGQSKPFGRRSIILGRETFATAQSPTRRHHPQSGERCRAEIMFAHSQSRLYRQRQRERERVSCVMGRPRASNPARRKPS